MGMQRSMVFAVMTGPLSARAAPGLIRKLVYTYNSLNVFAGGGPPWMLYW